MKQTKESITAAIEAKEQEYRSITSKSKNERREALAKIDALREAQKNPDSLEQYCDISGDIKNLENYLAVLDAKEKAANNGMLTAAEYKDMSNFLVCEIREKQEQAAPKIQKKLDEVIKLMDEYTEEVQEYEQLITRLRRLYTPKFSRAAHFANEISDINPDKIGWFSRFVYMYYSHHDTAQKIKAGAKPNIWGKY